MKQLTRALALSSLAAVSALALAARANDSAGNKQEPFGRLSVEEVQKLVDHKAAYIFDNNSPDRFAQGHVPTAKWVAFDDVKPADLPADKSATLVFYCGGERCHACHVAAESAVKLGYKNVNIMPAGISGWEKAKKKLEV